MYFITSLWVFSVYFIVVQSYFTDIFSLDFLKDILEITIVKDAINLFLEVVPWASLFYDLITPQFSEAKSQK